MGGHAVVYVPGYGLVPTVPAMALGWASSTVAGMPVFGGQPAHGGAACMPMQHPQSCTWSHPLG